MIMRGEEENFPISPAREESFRPSGVAATPRPCIILPSPRSITLPNLAHQPSLSLSLYPLSLEYTSSISRVDLVPPPPPPSIFFAAPPITETDDTVAPPLPAAPSIFASAFGYPDIFIDARSLAYSPPYLLVHQPRWIYEDRKSPLERTRKTSKDVNLRVARGRERESFV